MIFNQNSAPLWYEGLMLLTGITKKWPLPFYKTTGEEFRKSVKLYRNSVFNVSFSRNSAPGSRDKEFHRSVQKLPEFRILWQMFPSSTVSQTLMTPTWKKSRPRPENCPQKIQWSQGCLFITSAMAFSKNWCLGKHSTEEECWLSTFLERFVHERTLI